MFVNPNPKQVEMETLTAHEYRQKELVKGDKFEADENHVLLLKTLRRAKLVGEDDPPDLVTETAGKAKPKKKQPVH